MTFTVPTTEPTELAAGETWRWNLSLPDYPTADYDLAYTVKGPTAVTVAVADSATDANGYEMTVAATATAALTAGLYQWAALITETATGAKYVIRRGAINVRENFATATPTATLADRMVTNLETTLLARYAADVSSYSISGRALNRIEIDRLEAALAKWRYVQWAERHPGQAMPSQKVAFGAVGTEQFPYGVIPGSFA